MNASEPSLTEVELEPPKRRRLMRRARHWLLATATLGLAWLLISFAVGYALTHRKHAIYDEPPPQVPWAKFEGVRLTSSDGLKLGGWYAQGREDAPSVLLLHGNGAGRAHCLSRAEILARELGCTLLLISMRAHGDSEGDYNDIGYGAGRDVVAAVEFLRSRRPDRPIVIQGVSLGSAAATFAAEELGEDVDGYILESPYQDLTTAVHNRTSVSLPWPLDEVAFLGMRLVALVLVPHLDAISPERAAAAIPPRIPVLILSGEADELATPAEARAIFERVRDHGRLETFPIASHENLAEVDPERYRRMIVAFVAAARLGER